MRTQIGNGDNESKFGVNDGDGGGGGGGNVYIVLSMTYFPCSTRGCFCASHLIAIEAGDNC